MNSQSIGTIVLCLFLTVSCTHLVGKKQGNALIAAQGETVAINDVDPIGLSHLPAIDDLPPIEIIETGMETGLENPTGLDSPTSVLASSVPVQIKDSAQASGLLTGENRSASEAATPMAPMATTMKQRQGQQSLDEALNFCDTAQSFWQTGELNNALEALDKAYSLILDIDTTEEEKLLQQKEDLRFLISKRILEIYASRNIVVNGNHDEIPLEMNSYVNREIKRFTTGGEKRFFERSYERSGLYRPYIVQELKKAGLPEELSWLPLIESGFKTKALSRARALGLWQFIPSTGYKFGLKRDRYIDERMDFIKATAAAIAYLRELHNIFGDWATVLAAYNCGEGRVLQVIRTQNINYLDNFWDLYERLPSETARYVPRFFATLHLVKNLDRYGNQELVPDPGLVFDVVTVKRELRLRDIATASGIKLDALKTLNPELRYQIIPPDGYDLKIPKGYSQTGLSEKLAAIPTVTIPQQAYIRHTVRSGETLSTIARRYRSSVQKIMQANNLRSSHLIRVGKRLKILKSGYKVSRSATAATSPIPASGIHRVRRGDSLWKIAKRYGVTVQQIMSINELTNNDLTIGQKLKIAAAQLSPLPDKSKLKSYLVKRGDSPYTIAQRHNMALDRFLHINRLTPRSRIFPGQKLSIE